MTRALLLAGLLAAGCRSGDPVPTTAAAAARSEAPKQADESATSGPAEAQGKTPGKCRDWSKLDPAILDPLPRSNYGPLLDTVWNRVRDKHYDPTLGCLDWVALRTSYGEELAKISDEKAAYALINKLLEELEQSHFRLLPPNGGGGGGGGGEEAMGPASPKLQVRWVDEQFVVVSSKAKAVPVGSVVVSVDDKPLAGIVESVKARHERPSEVAFHVGRRIAARLSCGSAGKRQTLAVVLPGGAPDAPKTVSAQCAAPEGELVTLGNLSNVPTRVEHRMIPGTKVGYLAFNIWMLPMVERVRTAMTDLREAGMTALILDLRGNPGGVGPMSMPVARMVLPGGGTLGTLKFRDFEQEFTVEADDSAFGGPLAILVDEGTASTSEIFASGMRDLGRVKVFGGRSSAGAALPSVIEELDGGAILQYVVGDYHSPKGTVVEGKGVVPDVLVPEKQSAFAAGKDPVLDAAVEQLR